MSDAVNAEDELNAVEAQGGAFEQSVREQLKHRKEQFEAPTSKSVIDSLDALNRSGRELARKIATNKVVKWIPVVSPLINASLDIQKANVALLQGKDVDTGNVLSPRERAQMVISKYGSSLWEQTKVGVDVAFLAVGGTIVEKIGLKGAGVIIEHGAQIVAHEAVTKGGDRVIYGKEGRKIVVSPGDPKMRVAEHVVDGMPGMYSAVAGMTKDSESKKLLKDASSTFGKLIRNSNTREALAASLAQSEQMHTVMAKMNEFKSSPDAVKNFKTQINIR